LRFSQVRHDGRLSFFYPARDHQAVEVTGNFSGWRTPGIPLQRDAHGWHAEVEPGPGGDVEYKFITDGRWVTDPLNVSRRGENSLLCAGRERGSVYHLRFHSPALDEERGYVVYLPPGHDDGRRFPVLYLLHGALDWERSWVEKGALATTVDRARSEGAIGDLIVVMPSDNGDLLRGDGRFADYLARDVVGHVDFELPTIAAPHYRALDGLSTGGFTSIVLGVSRSHLYGSIGSMSGSHDERTFATIRAHAGAARAAGQRYRVSFGREEAHREDGRAVVAELQRHGVSAEYAEGPGIHDWPTWRDALWGHVCFHWGNMKG
jgi:enterochelin esterase family protein